MLRGRVGCNPAFGAGRNSAVKIIDRRSGDVGDGSQRRRSRATTLIELHVNQRSSPAKPASRGLRVESHDSSSSGIADDASEV